APLRGDRPRPGPGRAPGHPKVPGAGGAQSLRQHGRLPAAVRGLRQHHRLPGAELADSGPAAPAGPGGSGHVPGRDDRAAAGGHDGRRHVPLRPAPDVDRPPHPPGGPAIAEPGALLEPAAPDTRVAPGAAEPAAEERISVATQWQLMWWRFRRHRLAMAGTAVVGLFYGAVLFADFLAYATPTASQAPPPL